MNDKIKKLIEDLQEQALWASYNEWDVPITLGDNLNAAADLIEALAAELEQVKRERDAAVEDLKDYCYTGKVMCHYCKFLGNGRFCENECGDGECFEWRGVKED